MREFDSNNMYKLVKRTILSLSVFSVLLGIFMLYNVFYGPSRIENINKVCPSKSYKDCGMYYLLGRQEIESNGWKFLGTGVFLPLFFFTGNAIYKYIFPLKSKNKS